MGFFLLRTFLMTASDRFRVPRFSRSTLGHVQEVWRVSNEKQSAAFAALTHWTTISVTTSLEAMVSPVAKANADIFRGTNPLMILRHQFVFSSHVGKRDRSGDTIQRCHHDAGRAVHNQFRAFCAQPGRQDSVECRRCSTPLNVSQNGDS